MLVTFYLCTYEISKNEKHQFLGWTKNIYKGATSMEKRFNSYLKDNKAVLIKGFISGFTNIEPVLVVTLCIGSLVPL